MKIVYWVVITFLILPTSSHAQLYIEKKSRHRFAEMNVGVDYHSSFGGVSSYLKNGNIETVQFAKLGSPRILIGGTHF